MPSKLLTIALAVSALPRQDLAKTAEALVHLTAFLMRMSADQDETVAAPIDVALVSKGDGFTWIRHKELVRRPPDCLTA